MEFSTLWRNQPANAFPAVRHPCVNRNGTPIDDSQCAVRLSVALVRSGISMDSYKGTFCWFGHGRQHALVAEQLAHWLNLSSTNFTEFAEKAYRRNGPISHIDYIGWPGIILCRNFWRADNSGDHIDLWDGSRFAMGDNSYFHRSQEVWWWAVV
jgi:hypothetical protein